jgi:hypothetical protein
MTKSNLAVCVLVLSFAAVSPVHAEELDFRFGIENFRWREYDAAGARLLQEKGPRVHVGVDWSVSAGSANNLFVDVGGTLYFGSADYDGQACNLITGICSPYQSDATYTGAQVQATFARRFGAATAGAELFGGGGFDAWRRDIEGDATVQGAIEDWYVFYVLAGVGGYWSGPDMRGNARLGLKYPFYTEEYPDSYDVSLRPEGRHSLFANVKVDFMRRGKPAWGLGVYYDSYRFDESDKERDGSVVVWQPKSKQDVVGVFASIPIR